MPPIASGPPAVPIPPTRSSPSMMMLGSRSISEAIVDTIASRSIISAIGSLRSVGDVDVGGDVRRIGRRRGTGLVHRCVDQRRHFGIDGVDILVRQKPRLGDALTEGFQTVARF